MLLAAISQHEVALGLLLIVAFSLGLAATLTALGLAVVSADRRIVLPGPVSTVRAARGALPGGVGAPDRGRRLRPDRARAVPGVVTWSERRAR